VSMFMNVFTFRNVTPCSVLFLCRRLRMSCSLVLSE